MKKEFTLPESKCVWFFFKKMSKNGKLCISTVSVSLSLNAECVVLRRWVFEKTLLPAAGLQSPRLVWRAAPRIRKLHPSVCIGVHTVLFLGFLPSFNSGREWRARDSSRPSFPRESPYPRRICPLWSGEAERLLGSRRCDPARREGKAEVRLLEANRLRAVVAWRARPDGVLLQRGPTTWETVCLLPQLLEVAKLLPRHPVQPMHSSVKPFCSVQ